LIDEYKKKKVEKIKQTLESMGEKNPRAGSKTFDIQQLVLRGIKVKDIATMLKCHVSYVSHIKGMMKNEIQHKFNGAKAIAEEKNDNDKMEI
jgi:hypothetical protein